MSLENFNMNISLLKNETSDNKTLDYQDSVPYFESFNVKKFLKNQTSDNETLDYGNRIYSTHDYSTDSPDIDIEYSPSITIENIIKMSIVWYSVTLVLGLVGNGLVIWIAGFKMKTVSSTWFLHLAIADFITCIYLPLRISEWALFFHIPYEHYLCTIGMTLLYINMSTSVYFMSIIGIDRCISIFWPIWTRIHRTHRKAHVVSILTWVMSLLTSIPYVLFNNVYEEITECLPKHWFYYEDENKIKKRNTMLIIKSISLFALPFTIMLISYTLVFFKVRKVRNQKRSQRPFRLIIAVVVCFFICWFPYNTWPFITISKNYWNLDRLIGEISVCLAYFSSCINPIIYVFFCHDFKKNLIKSLPATLNKAFNEDSDLDNRDGITIMNNNANLETSLL